MLHISEPIVFEKCDDDALLCDAPLRYLDCKLRDVNQKSLVLYNSYELRALHLNGNSVNQQGNWAQLDSFLGLLAACQFSTFLTK